MLLLMLPLPHPPHLSHPPHPPLSQLSPPPLGTDRTPWPATVVQEGVDGDGE